jgi:hypothetical protein
MRNVADTQPDVDSQSGRTDLQRAHQDSIEAWYRARQEENAARVVELFARRHIVQEK